MPDLHPINSEESLLKEATDTTASMAAGQTAAPEMAPERPPADASEKAQLSEKLYPRALTPEEKWQKKVAKETNPEDADKPFHYRLPMGSYILAFLYGEFFLLMALSFMLVMLTYGQDVARAYSTIGWVGWLSLIATGLLCWFILSGKTALRFASITIAAIVMVYEGYTLINGIIALMQSSSAFSLQNYLFLSAFTGLNLHTPLILFIVSLSTGIYLLRPRVAAAYS
jgi:hypothetical protein